MKRGFMAVGTVNVKFGMKLYNYDTRLGSYYAIHSSQHANMYGIQHLCQFSCCTVEPV